MGTILYRIASLILLVLYADAIGADGVGKLEKFIALSLLLTPIVSLQLQDAAMSVMAKGGASTITTAASLLLLSTALFAAALLASVLFINAPAPHVAVALFAHVTTSVYWQFARNILRTRGELKRLSLSEGAQAVSSLLAAAAFIQMGHDFYSALTAVAIGNAATLVLFWILDERGGMNPAAAVSMEQGKLLLSVCSKLLPNVILWWAIEASDRWIYSIYASNAEIGIYSAGARIAGIGMAASLLFYQSWQTFGIHRINATEPAGTFFQKSFAWYSLATSLSFSGVISLAPLISKAAFGPEFSDASKFAAGLIPGLYLAATSYFFGIIYFKTHSTEHAWKSGLAGMISSVCTNFVLAPVIGIAGAPIASFLAFAVVTGLRYKQSAGGLGVALTPLNFYVPLTILVSQAMLTQLAAPPWIIWSGVLAILVLNHRLIRNTFRELPLRRGEER